MLIFCYIGVLSMQNVTSILNTGSPTAQNTVDTTPHMDAPTGNEKPFVSISSRYPSSNSTATNLRRLRLINDESKPSDTKLLHGVVVLYWRIYRYILKL